MFCFFVFFSEGVKFVVKDEVICGNKSHQESDQSGSF